MTPRTAGEEPLTIGTIGFKVNPDEWWHFDYQDWRLYRVLDVPFSEIHVSPRAPDAGRP